MLTARIATIARMIPAAQPHASRHYVVSGGGGGGSGRVSEPPKCKTSKHPSPTQHQRCRVDGFNFTRISTTPA